jgi:uncharacterized protein
MIRKAIFALLAILFAFAAPAVALAQPADKAGMITQGFEFVSGGKRLVGLHDLPANDRAKATIIIVHGYGETDVAGRTSYYDLRSLFTRLGIATVIWDKLGQGRSEGKFDINQPVEESAQEVVDAARQLRASGLPGSGKIGLWGISRAGWIAPMAIARDPDLAFWISVSGTDDKENFPYLLETNLRIEGRSEEERKLLLTEWRRGFEITSKGGSFDQYLAATKNLRRDPFMTYFGGESGYTREAFLSYQKQFLDGTSKVDPASGLMIYVPGFETILSHVNVPVLAIFGEKDSNVDWRKTSALYARTIGRNPKASLTIRTFPDGNHNLQQSRTGGFREMLEMTERRQSEGYHEAMEDWLRDKVLD